MQNKIVKIIDNNCVYPTYPEFIEDNFPNYAHLYIANKFPKLGDKVVVLGCAVDEIGELIYLVKSTDEFVFLIEEDGFEEVSLKECLRPGFVVEIRKGSQFFINNQMEFVPINDRNWFTMLAYTQDLCHLRGYDFDIVKIYNGRDLLFWERPDNTKWDDVSVGEEVWVRDNINDKWTNRTFIRAITELNNTVFQVVNKNTREIEHWNYCKIKK